MLITCNGYKFIYNWLVHGVCFSEAAECIFSTQAIAKEDKKHSTDNEKRFSLISISPKGRVLWVGYCKRQQGFETRIISARRASKKERRLYEAQFGSNSSYQAIDHDQQPRRKMTFRW